MYMYQRHDYAAIRIVGVHTTPPTPSFDPSPATVVTPCSFRSQKSVHESRDAPGV